METRHKAHNFAFLAPRERKLSTGARGRPTGIICSKKRKRSIAIKNLSYAHNQTKKAKTIKFQLSPIAESKAPNEDSKSKKIQILLEKRIKDANWENKRIFAVHSYYFLKSLGLDDCLQKAAGLYSVSESFVRKWKRKFKAQGAISVYTLWDMIRNISASSIMRIKY